MKPEKQSDYYGTLARTVAKKLDEDTPMKKAATKILMSNIGNRDMSINECMLICHNQPYVEYSRSPRIANLRGSTKVKKTVSENEKVIDDDNWQDAYWKRDEIEGELSSVYEKRRLIESSCMSCMKSDFESEII